MKVSFRSDRLSLHVELKVEPLCRDSQTSDGHGGQTRLSPTAGGTRPGEATGY